MWLLTMSVDCSRIVSGPPDLASVYVVTVRGDIFILLDFHGSLTVLSAFAAKGRK
jgi:hypothetical protein